MASVVRRVNDAVIAPLTQGQFNMLVDLPSTWESTLHDGVAMEAKCASKQKPLNSLLVVYAGWQAVSEESESKRKLSFTIG